MLTPFLTRALCYSAINRKLCLIGHELLTVSYAWLAFVVLGVQGSRPRGPFHFLRQPENAGGNSSRINKKLDYM